jgi:hypothetical protein
MDRRSLLKLLGIALASAALPTIELQQVEAQATRMSNEDILALVKKLLQNGLNAHDDLIEKALFESTSISGPTFLYQSITWDKEIS